MYHAKAWQLAVWDPLPAAGAGAAAGGGLAMGLATAGVTLCTLLCAWGEVPVEAKRVVATRGGADGQEWAAVEAVNTSAVVLATVAAGPAHGPGPQAARRRRAAPAGSGRRWSQARAGQSWGAGPNFHSHVPRAPLG